jgi:cation-dependent mannose-6-phosphate receptor
MRTLSLRVLFALLLTSCILLSTVSTGSLQPRAAHSLQSRDSSSDKKSKPLKPCTIRSPTSERFFDLNPIAVTLPEEGKKPHKDDRTESWHSRGHDYGVNFTINFCKPVVEEIEDVVGVKKAHWGNVSAFYEMKGKTYSIG